MIDEQLLQLARLIRGHQLGASGGVSVFGGQSDLFQGLIGGPTSAMPPIAFQTGFDRSLQTRISEMVRGGMDLRSNVLSQASGLPLSAIGTLGTLFPSLTMGGTLTDLAPGALRSLVASDPMAFLLQSAAANISRTASMMEAIQSRTLDPNTGLTRSEFSFLRGTRDIADVLDFATQTGQFQFGTTRPESLDASALEDAAIATLENFKEILEAGQQVFGPNASVAETLRRVQSIAGSTTTAGERINAAALVRDIGATAYLTGGNVEAAFQAQAVMRQQLEGMGITSGLASQISGQALTAAMRNAHGAQQSMGTLNERFGGTMMQSMSAEDMHGFMAQQIMSHMGQPEVQREIVARQLSAMYGRAVSADSTAVGALINMMGGDVTKFVTAEHAEEMASQQFEITSMGAGRERLDMAIASGLISAGQEDFMRYATDQRFGAGKDQARALREAITAGDSDAVGRLLRRNVSTEQMELLKTMELYAAADGGADMANVVVGDLTEEDLNKIYGDPTPRRGLLDPLLEKRQEGIQKRVVDSLSKMAGESDALEFRGIIGAAAEALEGQSAEELLKQGIVSRKSSDGSGVEYYQLSSFDGRDPAEVIADLLSGVDLEKTDYNDIMELFIEKLKALFEGMVPGFIDSALTSARA